MFSVHILRSSEVNACAILTTPISLNRLLANECGGERLVFSISKVDKV